MMEGRTAETCFEARALDCSRGGRPVLSRLDFKVAPGEALVVTGSNGAGKTTLLRLAAALGRPTAGHLSWDGADIARDREGHRQRVHLIGHQLGLNPVLSVAENVTFWARYLGGAGTRETVERACAALGVDHLMDMPVRYLSAGQQRRAALTRLATTPRPLWLLDEPTVGLDGQGRAQLAGLVDRHLAGGGMALVASHEPLGFAATTLDLAPYAAFAAEAA